MNTTQLWQRFQKYLCCVAALGMTLDVSRMRFDDGFLERMAPAMERAFAAMDALERGAVANPDEGRMVGHYWLRAPELAPTREIADEIRRTVHDVKAFAAEVHAAVGAALSGSPRTADQIATLIGARDEAETVYLLLEHLMANGRARAVGDGTPARRTFCKP